jgi:hypothetical protein
MSHKKYMREKEPMYINSSPSYEILNHYDLRIRQIQQRGF